MKIGLLGFDFSTANKGCEALTYSVISILDKVVDDKLIIVNFNYNQDLGFVEEYFPNIHFENIDIRIKDTSLTTFKELHSCDAVLDMTYGDNFSDIYSKKFVLKTTFIKYIVELLGVPLILMPQTYGPFKSRLIERFAGLVISRAKRVYSRDDKSTDAIVKYCEKNECLTVTDIAFLLPYERSAIDNQKVKVGLNVSGLLWRGGFGENNSFDLSIDYPLFIRTFLQKCIKLGFAVYLIPHVIDENNPYGDDDWNICQALIKEFPEVICAPKFKTPIEAKNYIANMDIFYGSRMHSTIGALSVKVPTVPISYSRKFEGLFGSIGYKYLIHGKNDTTNSALQKAIEYLDKRKEIYNDCLYANSVIRKKLDVFIEDFSNVLQNL